MNINDPAQATDLVRRIQADEPEAKAELFLAAKEKIRRHVLRELQCSFRADDITSETLQASIENIQRGELKNPAALNFYIHKIAQRMIFREIRGLVYERNVQILAIEKEPVFGEPKIGVLIHDQRPNPEAVAIDNQHRRRQWAVIEYSLHLMRPRDREVLTRFYLHEQSKQQIMAEMGLAEKSYELLKSRALGKLRHLATAA